MPELLLIRAARLDDPSRYKPQMVVWTKGGGARDHTDPALPNSRRYRKCGLAAASRRRRKIGSAPSDGIFGRSADDGLTHATLIFDAAGNLYSTTHNGGASGYGTVFQLTPSGALNVLHSFTGGSDGACPEAGLIADMADNRADRPGAVVQRQACRS
jgi:uncharacterized repeat protein (TIGR03803 family)